jgi:hypothetical protein
MPLGHKLTWPYFFEEGKSQNILRKKHKKCYNVQNVTQMKSNSRTEMTYKYNIDENHMSYITKKIPSL